MMSYGLQLDHIAINVKEKMDEAYNLFSELGFSITPRGYHSLGSINHSMIFKNDYLELIGNQKGKPINRPELRNAELGINGLVFKSDNVDKTYKKLVKINFNENPPRNFTRPVIIDKIENEAKFKTVSVKTNVFNAGRVYFCDHLTPNLVWLPEYLTHVNKSIGIKEIVIIDSKPCSVLKKFLKIDENIKVIKKVNEITLKTNSFLIKIVNLSSFKKRYEYITAKMEFRPSMFGSITLKLKSLTYLNKLKKNTLKKVVKFDEKNKVQMFIKDYNFVLEFI